MYRGFRCSKKIFYEASLDGNKEKDSKQNQKLKKRSKGKEEKKKPLPNYLWKVLKKKK